MARGKQFKRDEKKVNFDLPEHGRQKVHCSNPPRGPHAHAMDKLHEHVERAICAHCRCNRDQHFPKIGSALV